MTPVVESAGLVIRAGRKTLIDSISLAVRPAERIALVGPNGAGKTTLLRALSGELRSAAGHVRLKGREIARYSPLALSLHRAVLSQHTNVAFPFTVAEIVAMGAGDLRRHEIAALVDAALVEADLSELAGRPITMLSGGEQQRAHFARVLVQLAVGERANGPGLLLLDEPTASLDLRHQLDLLAATQRAAARGTAAVAILHDLNLAALFADRVVVLHGGRIAVDGTPREAINDEVVRSVFCVNGAVGRLPEEGVPFLLPQAIANSQFDAHL